MRHLDDAAERGRRTRTGDHPHLGIDRPGEPAGAASASSFNGN
ncbi:hypothetical protein [Streptomyces laurentii]